MPAADLPQIDCHPPASSPPAGRRSAWLRIGALAALARAWALAALARAWALAALARAWAPNPAGA
ncbi:hypothetical protein, partial [Cupriavidus cauae]|uniref:hypothetical protein n=1 Tax=Cupriavidus cauae TaxID=2608999 RepID=UPI001CC1F986